MLLVVWSPRAKRHYAEVIEYLSEHSLNAALKLDEQVDKMMSLIAESPLLFPVSALQPRFRKCVVSKHYSMIYEVKGKYVYVVAFIDNRSKPKY